MSKGVKAMVILVIALSGVFRTYGQDCSFTNSGFEFYSGCPADSTPQFSQFEGMVHSWRNMLNENLSTPDLWTIRPGCRFSNSFLEPSGVSVNFSQNNLTLRNSGCAWAGIFLEYSPGTGNQAYKEYIGQRVDLIAGQTYTLTLDACWNLYNSSGTANLGIYGYNGPVPANHSNFCLLDGSGAPAPLLAQIVVPRQVFDFTTYTVTFTPATNFTYLVLGGTNCGVNATSSGYVFIDNVKLNNAQNLVLNPIIQSLDTTISRKPACCYRGLVQNFKLQGNRPSLGVTATWSQSSLNPVQYPLTNPNDFITRLNGSGPMPAGTYEFYYTFTYNGCTATDTARVNVNLFQPVSAGPDINVCRNDQSWNMERRVTMNASPSLSEIQQQGYITWWSMIPSPGIDYIFQTCDNSLAPNPWGNYNNHPDVKAIYISRCQGIYPTSAISPDAEFAFRSPIDTVVFVWHVMDLCGTHMTDTMVVYMHDIDLPHSNSSSPLTTICSGDTGLVVQSLIDYRGDYIRPLTPRPHVRVTWSTTAPITLINPNTFDSLYFTGNVNGTFLIRVSVYDSLSNCTFSDEGYVSVQTSNYTVNAGNDILPGCSNNDYTSPLLAKRSVSMNALPSLSQIDLYNLPTWWSMIRADGSEWVFPNCEVPFDGPDEGEVFTRSIRIPSECPSRGAAVANSLYPPPNMPNAVFNFRNALDTVTFIWHVNGLNCSGNSSGIQTDTVVVFMRDVDLPPGSRSIPYSPIPTIACLGDTISLKQYQHPDFRQLRGRADLQFNWNTSLPTTAADIGFIGPINLADSVVAVMRDTGIHRVRQSVTDLNHPGCTFFDEMEIVVVPPFFTNAGSNALICNTTSSTFYSHYISAQPHSDILDYYNLPHWWSYIRPNGTEWVFPNVYVPFHGFDEGTVFFINTLTYRNIPYSQSSNINMYFREWGCYQFVWHYYSPCAGSMQADTIEICWSHLEEVANAGVDDTVTCNAYELIGNISSASAGNFGCYQWRQISGVSRIAMQNNMGNRSYLTGLDTIVPGRYQFEYANGCEPCVVKDTVSLWIMPGVSTSQVTLTTTHVGNMVCNNQNVNFSASGGVQYAFFVNGRLERNFSTVNTFTFNRFDQDTNVIQVLVRNSSGSSCLAYANQPIVLYSNSPPTPVVDTDFISICILGGFNSFPFRASAPGYNILWYQAPNLSTPINGPNGTPSDSLLPPSYLRTGLYYGYAFDTATGCRSQNAVSVNLNILYYYNGIYQNQFIQRCPGQLDLNGLSSSGTYTIYTNSLGTGTPLVDHAIPIDSLGSYISVYQSTRLYLFPVDIFGCTSTQPAIFDITILTPNMVPVINSDTVFNCSGLPVSLTASLTDTNVHVIRWYTNRNASGNRVGQTQPGQPLFVNPLQTTTYYAFDYNVTQGCVPINGYPYDSVVVIVEDCPVAGLQTDTLICANDTVPVLNTSTGIISSWQWYLEGSGSILSSNSQAPQLYFDSTGYYTLVLVVPGDTARTRIHVIDCSQNIVAAFSISDSISCLDSCIQLSNLTTANVTNWQWTFEGGTPLTYSGAIPPLVCYDSSGVFGITLVASNAFSSDTFRRNHQVVDCNPMASFSLSDTSICKLQCVDFTNTSVNGISYSWQFPGGIPASYTGVTPPSVCYNATGTYVATLITNNQNLSDTFQLVIQVNVCDPPTVLFEVSDTIICLGDCIDYYDLSIPVPESWQWYFEGGTPDSSNVQNPARICYEQPGMYSVSLSVTNEHGSNATTLYQLIKVNALPQIVITPSSATIFAGDTITLSASGGTTYHWTPDNGLSSADNSSPMVYPVGNVIYQVEATDANGCSGRAQATIEVLENGKFVLPNAFTPNGDGRNDRFFPVLTGASEVVGLTIYNRWGEKVHDAATPWDGTYKGSDQPVGAYTYFAKIRIAQKDGTEVRTINGTVGLIR